MDNRLALQSRGSRVINVALPAKAAYDFDVMQKVTRELVGRLGCENCHSGYDFRFELISRYSVDPQDFQLREEIGGGFGFGG